MSNKLLVVIGGPTGVGKTGMAIQVARHYQTEIISADSRQIYRELRIGVGRPSADQLARVPHHLIGYISIDDAYSAGQFVNDVMALLEKLFKVHQVVILTGGTGLYLKALLEGMDEMPTVPETISEKWAAIWKEQGIHALVEALRKVDPQYMIQADTSNPMRLIRALSVTEASGIPYSDWRTGSPTKHTFEILPLVLELPREELYSRINQRVLSMMEAGWLEEAKALYPFRHLKALQTVGYKELFQHLEGHLTLSQAVEGIQQSTRRYAKRQMTWWRHQGTWITVHAEDVSSVIREIDQRQ